MVHVTSIQAPQPVLASAAPPQNTLLAPQGLSNYLYKVGITTQPDLVVDKFESCVKRTFKLLPDGRLLRGTVTWVNTRVSKSPFFTEVHVHNFGDGPIQVRRAAAVHHAPGASWGRLRRAGCLGRR